VAAVDADTAPVTDTNIGSATVDVAGLLTTLAREEDHARNEPLDGARESYLAGAADAYAHVQTLVRESAGLPLTKDTIVGASGRA
jgi:hypothetical protein